jgi:hypothetical protein
MTAFRGRGTHHVSSGHHVAQDQVTVYASGDATVDASGNARVYATENATVNAQGSSQVSASDQATVNAQGRAVVEAKDNCTVNAHQNARVHAHDNTYVGAHDKAEVTSYGQGQIVADGESKVNELRPNPHIHTFEKAKSEQSTLAQRELRSPEQRMESRGHDTDQRTERSRGVDRELD